MSNKRDMPKRRDMCETLKQRIISSKINFSSSDECVDYLRSNFPGYARTDRKIIKRNVDQVLQSRKSRFSFNDEESSKDEETISKRKKKKRRNNDREGKSQDMENSYRERRKPSSSDSDSAEADGAVSTSEDAIYSEKVEPKFDLMKEMLRQSYSPARVSKSTPSASIEKNLEMEVVSDQVKNKIGMVNEDESGASAVKKQAKVSVSSTGVGLEVKMKEGPMFKDLGGMKNILEELEMEVIFPLYHPELPLHLGVKPIAGVLLHGPPGCGKTRLAHAIANETGVPFYKISATEVVSGVSGASEENIRELFAKAYRNAPSIVFIDEIDAIASKRENLQREMERRIVTQLMTCMDESHKPGDKDSKPGYVLVIGATNRPDAVDSALRRPGRFDREIALGVPDENARIEILSVLTRNLKVESCDPGKIARLTPGFVGADLAALANKAGNLAMKRIIDARKSELSTAANEKDLWWKQPWLPEEMESLNINMGDFEEAAKLVQPSSRREGFSTIPNVKWQDVGGLDYLRQEFDRYIVRRIKFPEDYAEFGVNLETGFLLYGPPGCGKTLIAKAIANESGANFIHIKGPELLNKYVGESELAVRTLFSRARTCSPCILFFDEVDALTTKRGKEGGWVVERLLNQLLIELDGADQRRGVFVIGATNRPDVMDRALLRPGRFGKLLYVPLPSPDERGLILKAIARGKPIDESVDLSAIGKMDVCEDMSGADLAALVNEAAMTALDEKLSLGESYSSIAPGTIKTTHFEQSLTKICPSVSKQQKQYYEDLSKKLQTCSGRNLEQSGTDHTGPRYMYCS